MECDLHPDFLLHNLYKPEHFIGNFVGVAVFIVVEHRLVGLKILAPKLIDLESAFVDVEMDITLLEIWCAGFPNDGFGVKFLDCKPRTVTDALRVLIGICEKYLKVIVICFLVDLEYHSADLFAVNYDSVCFVIRVVDTTLDGFAGNDLAVKIKVIVALAEFDHSAVLERPLIVKNKLLAVVCS